MRFFVVRDLRGIRKSKYPKMKDFAKECGLSERTIRRAESGRERVCLQSISIMAKTLEVKVDELIYKGQIPSRKEN